MVANALQIIDNMLAASRFLAGEQPTIADIVAFEELGQNQQKFANCTDYTEHPNITRWLAQMEQLPAFKPAHAIWTLLGDVNRIQGGMSTVAQANKEAARILTQAVDQLPPSLSQG